MSDTTATLPRCVACGQPSSQLYYAHPGGPWCPPCYNAETRAVPPDQRAPPVRICCLGDPAFYVEPKRKHNDVDCLRLIIRAALRVLHGPKGWQSKVGKAAAILELGRDD